MPSISIDLPRETHFYKVRADEIFWVNQGILRSTDLRDSLDEQFIADIAACIVSGQLIERAKDALDEIYDKGSPESERIQNALEVYESSKIADKIKYRVDELLKLCDVNQPVKSRDLIFAALTTNAFSSVFIVVLIVIHEIVVKKNKKVSYYVELNTFQQELIRAEKRPQWMSGEKILIQSNLLLVFILFVWKAYIRRSKLIMVPPILRV